MYCPVCKEVTLQMTHRQDIEIDYCPNCRGVWLDRGELDKLIERSVGARQDDDDDRRPSYESSKRYADEAHRTPKKKKSFLDEVFDIF